jgi:hypothetical protein
LRAYWPVTKAAQVQGNDRNQTSQESGAVDGEGDNNNHFKITQKIPEQHTRKARSQETTKHSLLDTANILGKVLKYEYRTFSMGNSNICGIKLYNYIVVFL